MNKKIILAFLAVGLSSSVFARGTSSSIFVAPYFGMGALGLGGSSDINDKIADIGTDIPNASKISWSKNFGAFMGYRFKHRYNVGLIIDYTSASKSFSEEDTAAFSFYYGTTTKVSGKYYEFSGGFSGTAFGPAFYYTIYNGGKLTFDLGLGILYAMKVNYFEDKSYSTIGSTDTAGLAQNAKSVSGSGKGFGFLLGTSTAYYFTNYMGIAFDLAYKYLKSSSITDANGNELYFTWADGTTDPTPVPLSVNLSGLYFGLSLKIEFDLSSSSSSVKSESKTTTETSDSGAGWEDTPVSAPDGGEGPSIEELRDIKKQVQRKWNDLRNDTSTDAQKTADRYRRLYDVVTKLEKDWDQFTPQSKAAKVEKIKAIINR